MDADDAVRDGSSRKPALRPASRRALAMAIDPPVNVKAHERAVLLAVLDLGRRQAREGLDVEHPHGMRAAIEQEAVFLLALRKPPLRTFRFGDVQHRPRQCSPPGSKTNAASAQRKSARARSEMAITAGFRSFLSTVIA
jgi:hypothetical protein